MFDACAHGLHDVEYTGAGRIDADRRQGQATTGCNGGTDNEKGGGGNIRRHGDVERLQPLTAAQADGAALATEFDATSAQHEFGVIAGRRRFGYSGHTIGIEPRQQHRRFNLGARHR